MSTEESSVSNTPTVTSAIGGRVWKPLEPSNKMFKLDARSYMLGTVAVITIALYAGFMWAAFHSVPDRDSAYQQEYGYSSVDLSANGHDAVVTTESGEEKRVDVVDHEGYFVLYDSREQLLEKMDKIDAGNYDERLKR